MNLEDDYAAREQVCDWLRANGIEPARTPMYPDASINDGQITIRQFALVDGESVPDPTGDAVMTETITVPVQVEPTGIVATWLTPRCPTCGR